MSLTVKTDDVTKGRKDLDPHGRLRAVTGGSGANGLKKAKKIAPINCRLDELICNIEGEDLLTIRRDMYGQLVLHLKG